MIELKVPSNRIWMTWEGLSLLLTINVSFLNSTSDFLVRLCDQSHLDSSPDNARRIFHFNSGGWRCSPLLTDQEVKTILERDIREENLGLSLSLSIKRNWIPLAIFYLVHPADFEIILQANEGPCYFIFTWFSHSAGRVLTKYIECKWTYSNCFVGWQEEKRLGNLLTDPNTKVMERNHFAALTLTDPAMVEPEEGWDIFFSTNRVQ